MSLRQSDSVRDMSKAVESALLLVTSDMALPFSPSLVRSSSVLSLIFTEVSTWKNGVDPNGEDDEEEEGEE